MPPWLGRRKFDREHRRHDAAFPATVDGAVKDKGGLYGSQCRGEDGHTQARLLGDAVDAHQLVKDQGSDEGDAVRHEEVDDRGGHDVYYVKYWTDAQATGILGGSPVRYSDHGGTDLRPLRQVHPTD